MIPFDRCGKQGKQRICDFFSDMVESELSLPLSKEESGWGMESREVIASANHLRRWSWFLRGQTIKDIKEKIELDGNLKALCEGGIFHQVLMEGWGCMEVGQCMSLQKLDHLKALYYRCPVVCVIVAVWFPSNHWKCLHPSLPIIPSTGDGLFLSC